MSNTVQSQREKLDKVYVCARCSGAFLFRSDLEGHKEQTGHVEAHTIAIEWISAGWIIAVIQDMLIDIENIINVIDRRQK